jgi:hypothetical protein
MKRLAIGGLALTCLAAGLAVGMGLGHPARAAGPPSAVWRSVGSSNGFVFLLDDSGQKLRLCWVTGEQNFGITCSAPHPL